MRGEGATPPTHTALTQPCKPCRRAARGLGGSQHAHLIVCTSHTYACPQSRLPRRPRCTCVCCGVVCTQARLSVLYDRIQLRAEAAGTRVGVAAEAHIEPPVHTLGGTQCSRCFSTPSLMRLAWHVPSSRPRGSAKHTSALAGRLCASRDSRGASCCRAIGRTILALSFDGTRGG